MISFARLVFQLGIPLLAALAVSPAMAGEVDVEKVEVDQGGGGYTFSVTLRHADTGWDHYANRWDVLDADGTVLGVRVLYHPHVDEQPFTRSLSGVKIPAGVTDVTIRANDSVHGTGGMTMTIKVPGR